MLAAIFDDLKRLAVFSGREARSPFWIYLAFVLALLMAGSFAVIMPMIASSVVRMQTFALEHPDLATVRSGAGGYSIQIEGSHPEFFPPIGAMASAMGVMIVVAVGLLAAAVARRLHDCGRSGLFGLLPLPFLAFALAVSPRVFGAFENPDSVSVGLFLALFFNNILYIASLGILAVLLAGKGGDGPNRYGPEPIQRR